MIYAFKYSAVEQLSRNYPISEEKVFDTSAMSHWLLGPLPDVLSAEVERNTEGVFTLTMTYPRSGENGDKLVKQLWLLAPVGGTIADPQYFQITDIYEDITGTVSIQANHISYNANDIVLWPFTAAKSTNSNDVAFYPWYTAVNNAAKSVSTTQMGKFAVFAYTDDLTLNAARYTEPVSLKKAVLDAAEGRDIIVTSDGINLKLWKADDPILNPSFAVRYAKNMMEFKNQSPDQDFYTRIFPYLTYDEGGGFVTLSEKTFSLKNVGSYWANVEKIRPLDMTDMYGMSEDSYDLLVFRDCVNQWLNDHPFEEMPEEINVSSVPDNANKYELGLTGDVFYSPSNYAARVTITSLKYDVLKDRVTSIGIGKPRHDVASLIAELAKGALG